MRWVWDTVTPHRVGDDATGGFIVRGAKVFDILTGGDSPASVFLKIIRDSACPGRGTAHPDTTLVDFTLDRRDLFSIDKFTNAAEVHFTYRGPSLDILGGGAQTWAISTAPSQSAVSTLTTADGSQNILSWYKPGTVKNIFVPPPGSQPGGGSAQKIVVGRVMKARKMMSRVAWKAMRAPIEAIEGYTNLTPWGAGPMDLEGSWLFLGATVEPLTVSVNSPVQVSLDFIRSPEPGGFFALLPFFDTQGRHPPDAIDLKDIIDTHGIPPPNGQRACSGLTIASVQRESNFNGIFPFSPQS